VPLVDDVKVTLDYDMSALLAAPRWADDLQQYVDLHNDPALAIIVGGWPCGGRAAWLGEVLCRLAAGLLRSCCGGSPAQPSCAAAAQ
jgi:hypothetical protein